MTGDDPSVPFGVEEESIISSLFRFFRPLVVVTRFCSLSAAVPLTRDNTSFSCSCADMTVAFTVPVHVLLVIITSTVLVVDPPLWIALTLPTEPVLLSTKTGLDMLDVIVDSVSTGAEREVGVPTAFA